jgi:hypothetical protein
MQFLFQGVIGEDGGVLLNELAASSLVLLFEGSFEVTEFLVLCCEGVS